MKNIIFSLTTILIAQWSIFSLPNILINTMPKSGSIHLIHSIDKSIQNMEYTHITISQNRFHDDYIDKTQIQKVRYITQEHIDASPGNIKLLKEYLPKFILHLRDPRQALISWFYHVEKVKLTHTFLWSADICPSKEYFDLNFSEKMDWQIENYLPRLVDWLSQWKAVIEKNELDILVTRFEDMKKDEVMFFRRILDFYGFYGTPVSIFPFRSGIDHYRLGAIDEWQEVLTIEQIKRMEELIPNNLLEFFGWE